jgi:hypothetical protein
MRFQRPALLSAFAAAAVAAGPLLPAQPLTRKATTVEALLGYPVFFHGAQVAVRGEVEERGRLRVLTSPAVERELQLVWRSGTTREGAAELRGDFWDLGRLNAEDPRLAGLDLQPILDARSRDGWPGIGEVHLLSVAAALPAEPFPAPSIRALALDPDRYEGQRVTVTGRFRGRNLYGDLPQAPGVSRWDFILQSADAAIWVTGLRPRGRGFSLDPSARVDTAQWLEASGVVRHDRGLVRLEATHVALAQPPEETPTEPPVRVPVAGPPAEVVFSTPLPDEIDVPRGEPVRIQFSRDMAADSFKGRVRLEYPAGDRPDAAEPIEFTIRYREGNRVLEIQPGAPLERFRTVRVRLLEGITAFDGAPLVPWTLTFSVGP